MRFAAKRTTDSIARITIRDFRTYGSSSLKDLSTGTVNYHLRMLNLIFDFAFTGGLLEKKPA